MVVREAWKQRHGYRAALLVVVYPEKRPNEAVVCGPPGDNPTMVDLDLSRVERLADAALGEPYRHLAIRFLAEALEGDSDEQPGLRNKGLLATHELLYGVPRWAMPRSSLGWHKGDRLMFALHELVSRADTEG